VPPPLVPAGSRRYALAAIGASVVVAAGLGAAVYHRRSTSFDGWAFRGLIGHTGSAVASVLLAVSTPAAPIVLMAVVVMGALVAHRWDAAALAVGGPSLALLLTEVVLKPVIGRVLGPAIYEGYPVGPLTGSYPSGHETGVVSAAVVLFLVARQLPLRRRDRAVLVAVLVSWAVASAVGLVRNYWHYATDVIGGAAVSIAVVLASALLIDRFLPARPGRVSSPGARSPASTSRAA
jgi:undecaprenyl-diphosphatase